MKCNKNKLMYLLIFILFFFGMGYAYLSTTLSINGTTDIDMNNWDIYFDNIVVSDGSVTGSQVIDEPEIGNDDVSVMFHVNLKEPGEFYEFTVDAKNDGTIDAMIESVVKKLNGVVITTLPAYLNYTVTYIDGTEILENHLLEAESLLTYKVRVEYRSDINPSDLPSTAQSLTLSFAANFVQADGNAINIYPMAQPLSALDLGDYIYMVPDLDSYTVTKELTGNYQDQYIAPSELSLWRVIQKNNDGTIDAISEYTSTGKISLTGYSTSDPNNGVIGFANYVGILQTIAAQYKKEGYTKSVRSFGYDGQTLEIEDTSAFDGNPLVVLSTTSTPTIYSGTGQEYGGGVLGDTLYIKDYLLVKNVYDNMYAYQASGTWRTYFIASRCYKYRLSDNIAAAYGIRILNHYGEVEPMYLRQLPSSMLMTGQPIRPIITVYDDIKLGDGDGSIDDPYILVK